MGYCRRLAGAKRQDLQNQVEDVVQRVFLLAVARYSKLEHHPNIVGWLKKSCQYEMKNLRKTSNRRAFKHSLYADDSASKELPDQANQYEQLLQKEEDQEILQKISESLSTSEKVVYQAFFVEEKTMQTTADLVGRSLDAIKSIIYRIRKRAREIKENSS